MVKAELVQFVNGSSNSTRMAAVGNALCGVPASAERHGGRSLQRWASGVLPWFEPGPKIGNRSRARRNWLMFRPESIVALGCYGQLAARVFPALTDKPTVAPCTLRRKNVPAPCGPCQEADCIGSTPQS